MKLVYECDLSKKSEVSKVLEADPYADDSFARVGYKVKEGSAIGEDSSKIYIYLSCSADFAKKASVKLKGIASKVEGDVEKRIVDKIEKEEENAESGFGSIFGG